MTNGTIYRFDSLPDGIVQFREPPPLMSDLVDAALPPSVDFIMKLIGEMKQPCEMGSKSISACSGAFIV